LSQKGTGDPMFASQPLTKAPNFGASKSLGNRMIGIALDAYVTIGKDLH